jgi:hypothetical protein
MSHYIGAKDRIDRLLVQKYADLKTNNIENSMNIPVDHFWKVMNLVAQYERTIMEVKNIKQVK